MNNRYSGLLAVYLSLFPCLTLSAPSDFDEAKRLAERVYSVKPETFYCGCRIEWNKSGKDRPNLASCGYEIRKNGPRANQIEWEHVVPASDFGRQRQCWQNGGRKNCQDSDPTFRAMEGDLHNLVPSIGEVNGDRSNFRFGVLPGEPSQYGRCQIEIDSKQRTAEPRDAIKGDIARIYFYMADRYKLKLSRQQQQLFSTWNRLDPVDQWELERDRRIAQYMGHSNPFVKGKMPASSTLAPASANKPTQLKQVSNREIRGNKNSMVYHRPDCPSYNTVSERNRLEFESATEAEQAGYRLARNCP